MSNGFLGVVKDGARKGDACGVGTDAGASEKKNGWLFGSRSEGNAGFSGDWNSLCEPISCQLLSILLEQGVLRFFAWLSMACRWKGEVRSTGPCPCHSKSIGLSVPRKAMFGEVRT